MTRRGRLHALRRVVLARPGPTVLVAAAIPRLLVFVAGARHPSAFLDDDSVGYLRLADHPSGYWDRHAAGWVLGCLRPPGYPALLAVPRLLGHGLVPAAALQVGLGVLAAWLAFVAGRSLLGAGVGLVAGLVVAVEPLTVSHSAKLLTESPYTVLLLLATIAIVHAHRAADDTQRRRAAVAIGATLAAAAFVRPIGVYLPLVLLPALALGGWTGDRRRGAKTAGMALIVFALPVGAWVVRNEAATGTPVFTTIQSYNLLEYRAAPALALDRGRPLAAVRLDLHRELHTVLPPAPGPGAASRARQRIALRVLRQHPAAATEVTMRGMGRTLVGSGRADARSATAGLPAHRALEGMLVVLGDSVAIALLVVGALGTIRLLRRRSLAGLLVAIVVGYHLAVGSGAESGARFRIPLLPFLAIAAASAVLSRVHRAAQPPPPRP